MYKFIAIGAIAVVGTIGYNIGFSQDDAEVLFMSNNVEALAGGESGGGNITGWCLGDSREPCQVNCPDCPAIYVVDGKNAPAANVKGTCERCGHQW